MDIPCIDIVIPVNEHSKQLDRTVELIQQTTQNYNLKVVIEPDLNVSEARQLAMQAASGRYVCFLDYDSEMIQPAWLATMYEKMYKHSDAAIVFAKEWWGTEPRGPLFGAESDGKTYFGTAACMLIDLERLPKNITWNPLVSLRNGWLGGDFEERDFCMQVTMAGLNMYQAPCLFHHVCRTTMAEWLTTDRGKTAAIMGDLICEHYATAPEDKDWFKGLIYQPARRDDDRMLAPGRTLRQCYQAVIKRNGLQNRKVVARYDLV